MHALSAITFCLPLYGADPSNGGDGGRACTLANIAAPTPRDLRLGGGKINCVECMVMASQKTHMQIPDGFALPKTGQGGERQKRIS